MRGHSRCIAWSPQTHPRLSVLHTHTHTADYSTGLVTTISHTHTHASRCGTIHTGIARTRFRTILMHQTPRPPARNCYKLRKRKQLLYTYINIYIYTRHRQQYREGMRCERWHEGQTSAGAYPAHGLLRTPGEEGKRVLPVE